MKITCGIVIINNKDEVLACHPTNSSMNIWSIPKGLNDEGESFVDTVCRELREETNLLVKPYNVIEVDEFYTYPSKNKKLKGFYIRIPYTIATTLLECNSMIINKSGVPFPEVDQYKWISLDNIEELHVTQQQLIKDII